MGRYAGAAPAGGGVGPMMGTTTNGFGRGGFFGNRFRGGAGPGGGVGPAAPPPAYNGMNAGVNGAAYGGKVSCDLVV